MVFGSTVGSDYYNKCAPRNRQYRRTPIIRVSTLCLVHASEESFIRSNVYGYCFSIFSKSVFFWVGGFGAPQVRRMLDGKPGVSERGTSPGFSLPSCQERNKANIPISRYHTQRNLSQAQFDARRGGKKGLSPCRDTNAKARTVVDKSLGSM